MPWLRASWLCSPCYPLVGVWLLISRRAWASRLAWNSGSRDGSVFLFLSLAFIGDTGDTSLLDCFYSPGSLEKHASAELRTQRWDTVTWQRPIPPPWSVVRVASVGNYCISPHNFLQTLAGGTEVSVFAEVMYELVLKDMEHFKRDWVDGFRQEESSVSWAKASVLDHSVDLEYRYEEGACVGRGEIRLQGEFRVEHGSFFFF